VSFSAGRVVGRGVGDSDWVGGGGGWELIDDACVLAGREAHLIRSYSSFYEGRIGNSEKGTPTSNSAQVSSIDSIFGYGFSGSIFMSVMRTFISSSLKVSTCVN
jgi:hypothetical protein